MKTSSFISAALLAASTTMASAAPIAGPLSAGMTFQQYTGTAVVGNGQVNTSDVLWYVDEKTVGNLKSWFIFFDPVGSQTITATLTFDHAIVGVITDRIGLFQSQPTYSIDIDHDGVFDDYLNPQGVGLEADQDTVTWTPGSNTMTIRWTASNPGDHVRVLTAVPEPASWGLAGVALAALVGTQLRRRKG